MNFHSALLRAKSILRAHAGLVSRGLIDTEAEQLVMASLRQVTFEVISRMELYFRAHEVFPDLALVRLESLAQERARGKPLQHLVGFQNFLAHEYQVNPSVLIPRPETEVLVRSAISFLEAQRVGPQLGIEIGLGSGVISIELLAHFQQLTMIASELSEDSIVIAEKNFHRVLAPSNGGRLKVLHVKDPSQVLSPFRQPLSQIQRKADFLISNPPYLASSQEVDEEVFISEPKHALFTPNQDPFYFYRAMAESAQEYLVPGGPLFAELPHERAESILKLFLSFNWEATTQLDLAGRVRILVAHLRQ